MATTQQQTKKGNGSSKQIIEEVERSQNGVGGRIEMSADVVATIAAMAAREIPGIHSLGKSRLIPFGGDTRGVEAEVGQQEAALDLEVIIEHGCNLREVANELRQKVAEQVNQMAGRKVVEVNLDVVGVHLPEEEKPEPEEPRRRVR